MIEGPAEAYTVILSKPDEPVRNLFDMCAVLEIDKCEDAESVLACMKRRLIRLAVHG